MSDVKTLDKTGQKGESDFKADAGAMTRGLAAKKLNENYNLPDIYDIIIDSPLPKLSSSYAKAFEVIDKKQKGYL